MDRAIIAVERAKNELRRGGIVAIKTTSAWVAVAAAEGMLPETLFTLNTSGNAVLVLSAMRARHIGLMPGREHAVRLALPEEGTADFIARIITPAPGDSRLGQTMAGISLLGAEAVDATAVKLAKIAELLPAVLVSPPLEALPKDSGWLEVEENAIETYEENLAHTLRKISEANVPLKEVGLVRLATFRPQHGGYEHMAILIGTPETMDAPLVRVHSSCITGDVLGSLRCDCGDQLHGALMAIKEQGGGVVVYVNQEGRGIGLANKIRAYTLQDAGMDTMDANEALGYDADERAFLIAARILDMLGIRKLRLLTNNPGKIQGLTDQGIEVAGREPLVVDPNGVNDAYLATKAGKGGHLF